MRQPLSLRLGLSTAAVVKVHTVLHGALRQAVKLGLVGRNLTEAVEPPRPVETEKRALTPEQIKALLAAAAGDRLEALYWMATGTGLRQGELFALRWSDVDLEAGTLQVQRKVCRVGKLGLQEGQPKSRKGRRGTTLPAIVAAALRRYLDRQQAEAATHGASWRVSPTTRSAARPISPQRRSRPNCCQNWYQPAR
jgi:integrase